MAVIDQCVTEKYAIYQGDCCEVIKGMPANSVHMSISSPPFESLYSYTDALQDMSNVRTDGEFFEGMAFLVEELARVMMPGRIVAFHCMNLPRHEGAGSSTIGIRDFRGDLIRLYQRFGFIFHSEVLHMERSHDRRHADPCPGVITPADSRRFRDVPEWHSGLFDCNA